MITADEVRSAGVARAWQLGHRLADLLTTHDVPRPERVHTSHYSSGDGREGQTHLSVRMAAPADLFRLAHRAGAQVHTCATSKYNGAEQAYCDLGYGQRRQLVAYWAGPVSS